MPYMGILHPKLRSVFLGLPSAVSCLLCARRKYDRHQSRLGLARTVRVRSSDSRDENSIRRANFAQSWEEMLQEL